MSQVSTTPSSAAAPPTTFGSLPAAREASLWPIPVGTISVVIGLLGFLGSTINLLSPLFIGALQNAMPAPARAQIAVQNAVTQRWLPVTIPVAAVQIVLAIALLWTGTRLISRRRSARTWAVCWAVPKVLIVVVAAYVGDRVQAETTQAMQASGQLPPGTAPMIRSLAALGIALWIAIGWAWPVFLLSWLSRPVIRREMAEWA